MISAYGQAGAPELAPGDTTRTVDRTALWDGPAAVALVGTLPPRTPVTVTQVRDQMVAVSTADRDGWVHARAFQPVRDRRETGTIHVSQPPRLSARPTWRSSSGWTGRTVRISRLFVYRNRAGGLSLSVLISNLSPTRTLKHVYVTVGPRAYGDSLATDFPLPPRTIHAVGPLHPGQTASYDFRNVWPQTGDACVAVRRVRAVHLDGSRFVYRSGRSGARDASRAHRDDHCTTGRPARRPITQP